MDADKATETLWTAYRVIDGREPAPIAWAIEAGAGVDPIATAWAACTDNWLMAALVYVVDRVAWWLVHDQAEALTPIPTPRSERWRAALSPTLQHVLDAARRKAGR